MVQDVFLKTSQAFVPIGKVAKGDNATFGGQHWLVSVGRFHYESMSVDGLNKARHTAGTGHTRDGTVLVGQTTKTEAQLAQFASDWNKRGQKGSHKYCVVDNSCQHFAKELINYACNGRYTIPESFGGRFVIEPGRVDVSFGTGELVATRAGPVDAHISGPAIGAHGSRNGGVKVKAELFNESITAGPVGVNLSPNLNTGATYDGRNAEASVLGLGAKVGKDGLGISTPLGGFTLKLW